MHVNPALGALLEQLNNPSLPGIDLSLERMCRLLDALGNPERRLPPVIHVAGTNGKGSTIAYLRAAYEASGRKVHVYTSPHLVRFNERIVLAGEEVADDVLLAALLHVKQASAHIPVTFFEATTAAALCLFAEHSADMLILEVGLGGRLDATNVVPAVAASVITPIGRDHVEFLGDSLTQIATEKAGIMKPATPVFTAPQVPEVMAVLVRHAASLDSPLTVVSADNTLPAPALPGEHQRLNAALAAAVVRGLRHLFPVPDAALVAGIRHARWPARLQHLRAGPLVQAWGARGPVLLDGGHNAHAAEAIARWLVEEGRSPAYLICGLMKRKDALAFFAPLQPVLERIVCVPIPGAPDAYDPAELAALLPTANHAADMADALNLLASVERGTLLVAGSLYLAGDILKNHS